MKKRKFVSGATTGAAFEDKIDQWLNDAKIEFYKDETLTNSKRRVKDIKCDRKVIIDDKPYYIELKTTTEKQNLTYKLYEDGGKYNIKFHQIARMDYLILEFRPNLPIVIDKQSFLAWACTKKKNSIIYKDAKEIGFEIQDMKWLYELTSH